MKPIRVVFDTNVGTYTFSWRARDAVELFYPDEDSPRETINIWDDMADAASIKRDGYALATFGQEWLREHERGVQIHSAQEVTQIYIPTDQVDSE